MAEEEIIVEDDAIALEDSDDTSVSDTNSIGLIPFIMDKYQRADNYRENDEER